MQIAKHLCLYNGNHCRTTDKRGPGRHHQLKQPPANLLTARAGSAPVRGHSHVVRPVNGWQPPLRRWSLVSPPGPPHLALP